MRLLSLYTLMFDLENVLYSLVTERSAPQRLDFSDPVFIVHTTLSTVNTYKATGYTPYR